MDRKEQNYGDELQAINYACNLMLDSIYALFNAPTIAETEIIRNLQALKSKVVALEDLEPTIQQLLELLSYQSDYEIAEDSNEQ